MGTLAQTAEVIKTVIRDNKFWRQDDERKIDLLYQLHAEMNRIWGTQADLKMSLSAMNASLTGGGSYLHNENMIIIHKLSLMTYLHEYCHAIAYRSGCIEKNEEDAILLSHAMFYLAMPRLYSSSRDKGLFFHKPSMDKIFEMIDKFEKVKVEDQAQNS